MSITVTDVYNSLMSSSQYSSNLKTSGNSIWVYLDIPISKKNERIQALTEIKDFLTQKLPNFPIAYNKRPRTNASIGRIEIPRVGGREIVVYLKPIPIPKILKSWSLNEDMIVDISNEYKSYADEDGMKYNITISDGTTKIEIPSVRSVVGVGGQNKKPDLKIIKVNGQKKCISIKLPVFRAWQGVANTSELARAGATKVLDNIPNIKGAFGKGSNGVSVKATVNEVKEFCFGGDATNKVDYIIVANFPNKSIQESFNYDDNLKTLFVTVDKIYDRNQYEEVSKDCYMLIESNPTLNIGNKYRGFKISYVPKSIADNALPGKR